MKYIYGPVQSRRLGLSLGVSLAPYKTCNFDCVYCQLGPTIEKAHEQKEYAKIEDILAELKGFLLSHKEEVQSLNYITLSGSGEPTLNTRISELIREIKKISSLPIAVITNSSLLADEKARQGLSNADLIVPSLDAATQDVFVKINHPADNLKIGDIIESLIKLKREFKGKIWLEVMLAKGINDSLGHIKKLKEIADKINPDKIQLNSPVRTTAYAGIKPVGIRTLEKIKEIFGDRCEII
jgi:wyosine [tRNA(Phe)-imidazoG37] synthetase (radical SAM superfamily)